MFILVLVEKVGIWLWLVALNWLLEPSFPRQNTTHRKLCHRQLMPSDSKTYRTDCPFCYLQTIGLDVCPDITNLFAWDAAVKTQASVITQTGHSRFDIKFDESKDTSNHLQMWFGYSHRNCLSCGFLLSRLFKINLETIHINQETYWGWQSERDQYVGLILI